MGVAAGSSSAPTLSGWSWACGRPTGSTPISAARPPRFRSISWRRSTAIFCASRSSSCCASRRAAQGGDQRGGRTGQALRRRQLQPLRQRRAGHHRRADPARNGETQTRTPARSAAAQPEADGRVVAGPRPVPLGHQRQDLLAVLLDLARAKPAHRGERLGGRRAAVGDLAQRGVVGNHVGRHPIPTRALAPPGGEPLQRRLVRRRQLALLLLGGWRSRPPLGRSLVVVSERGEVVRRGGGGRAVGGGEAVLERLSAWRRERASRDGMPPT